MATYDDDGNEITGNDVLLWLESMVHTGKLPNQKNPYDRLSIKERENLMPKHIKLVTDNAGARDKMEKAIISIRRKLERLKRNDDGEE